MEDLELGGVPNLITKQSIYIECVFVKLFDRVCNFYLCSNLQRAFSAWRHPQLLALFFARQPVWDLIRRRTAALTTAVNLPGISSEKL
jgi:hypothetical protein